MEDPTVIGVIGMGRCGTSLVARLLNLLGVSLGPAEHLMGPAASNPRGHWEHQLLVDLNDEILAAYGGRWDEPPTFAPGWHKSPAMAELRERARRIVEADFGGVELWGWKDPRSSLTLPFWQDLLPPMRYIICLRNPLDVAQSLVRRDEYPIEKSGRLWLTYTASAIAHTSGHPRIFVFYEDLMDGWKQQVPRLAAFIGRPDPNGRSELLKPIEEFVDQALAHHRSSLVQTLTEAAIPYPTQALYLMLRGHVRMPPSTGAVDEPDGEELGPAIDVFSQLCIASQSRLDALEAQLVGSTAQLALAIQTVRSQERSLEGLRSQLTERERQVAGMEQSLSWRWTSPLRSLKRRLRAWTRRP